MNDIKTKVLLENKFSNEEMSVNDLYEFFKKYDNNLKESTLRWRLHYLKSKGVLYSTKRGFYRLGSKKEYSFRINSKMKEIYKIVNVNFPYSDIVVWNSLELSDMMVHQPLTNLTFVEVDVDSLDSVYRKINENFENVFVNPDRDTMKYYIDGKNEAIVVKKLLAEAPIDMKSEVPLPKVEKLIVDLFVEKEIYKTYQGNELINIYNELFNKYVINFSTLRRYLNRRKCRENFKMFIEENTIINLEV